MKHEKTTAFIIFSFGIILGLVITLFIAPITSGRFYDELRKRSLSSSEHICNEAKQAKFLYEQFKIQGR